MIFLGQYLTWEVEELACVYDFLELAVFQYGNPGPLRKGTPQGNVVHPAQRSERSATFRDDIHPGSVEARRRTACCTSAYSLGYR